MNNNKNISVATDTTNEKGAIPVWANPGTTPTDAIHDWAILRIISGFGAAAVFVGFFILLGLLKHNIIGTINVLFSLVSLVACVAMFVYSIRYYRLNAQKIKTAYQRVYAPRKFGGKPVLIATGMDSNTISQYNSIRRANPLS